MSQIFLGEGFMSSYWTSVADYVNLKGLGCNVSVDLLRWTSMDALLETNNFRYSTEELELWQHIDSNNKDRRLLWVFLERLWKRGGFMFREIIPKI